MDRSGVAYVPEKTIHTTWKITDDVQLMLKKPFGKLFSGTESDPSIALKKALKEGTAKYIDKPPKHIYCYEIQRKEEKIIKSEIIEKLNLL